MRAIRFLPILSLMLMACHDGARKLVGDYRLRQTTAPATGGGVDTSYFLWNTARPENEVAWSGAILRIGWDAQHIVALLAPPNTPYGIKEGWMVIDLSRGTHVAALTDAQLQQQPGVAQIKTVRSDSVWAQM